LIIRYPLEPFRNIDDVLQLRKRELFPATWTIWRAIHLFHQLIRAIEEFAPEIWGFFGFP